MADPISQNEFCEALLDGVRRAQAGDQEAFKLLFEALAPTLRRKAHEYLERCPWMRKEGDSDDFLHRLLIRFVEDLKSDQLPEFTREQFLITIETMARDNLRDEARALTRGKRDARRKVSLAEALSIVSREPLPPQQAIAREFIALIRKELMEEEWTVVIGRYEGRTWKEIATKMERSRYTVRRCWKRAQRHLRHFFAPPRQPGIPCEGFIRCRLNLTLAQPIG